MPFPPRFLTLIGPVGWLGLLFGVTPAAAQTARLEGVVTDSIRHTPLAGALVQVGEVPGRFATDSSGRFEADSLPPGSHEVRFTHPVLDSLGMRSGAVVLNLTAGTTTQVALGTPSGRTFLQRLCPAPAAGTGAPEGRAAVLGVVRATDSDAPIADAAVQLQWSTMIIDEVLGFRRKVEVLNAKTDETGLYLLCNAPAGIEGALLVAAEGYDSAAAGLTLGTETAAVQHFMLAPRPDSGIVVAGTATLTGTIRDEEGAPLGAADVVVVDRFGNVTHGPARTDAAGRYTLRDAPAGTRLVEVRRIGSSPERRTVTLAAGRPTRLDVTLASQAVVLEEVEVEGESSLDRSGFTMRRGIGQGQFLTRENILRRNAPALGDLLDQYPDLQVDGGRIYNRNRRQNPTGSQCEIATFHNGMITPADFLLNIPRDDIEGIEIYPVAGNVPMEFVRPETSCGAILIWTKQPGGDGK